MNSRLFLPDSQASAVQFPPSCPVIFVEPAKRSSFDVDGSEAATASANDKGMAVRLGKVTSVYIDISAGSNRELIYVVEVPNPKKDASSPSTSTTRTTIDVAESSLRYAPNCPALFDLENLAVTTQDATSERPRGSTIMPALDTAAAARGTILCGIPTTCILAGNLQAVSYSALVYLEDGGLREYHNIPLRCIRFDPTSTTNAGTNAIAPLTSNLSTNISNLDTTKPNIISKQSSIDDNANDNDEDGSDAEDTKCRTPLNANKCEELNLANSSVPNPSSNIRNLITTKSITISEQPKSLANKTNCPPPTSGTCTAPAVVCASPQTKANTIINEPIPQRDAVQYTNKGNSAVVSPTVVRSSPHFRRLQLHLEKESSTLKQLQPPDLSLSRNEIEPREKGRKGKTQDRKSTKVTATKKSKPRKKGHGSRRSSGFGRSRGRTFARNDGFNSKGRC